MYLLVSLFAGLLLGFGLSIANMTKPDVVLAFLDISGNWDVTLMFVMAGAIGVHLLLTKLVIARRGRPLLQEEFYLPENTGIDRRTYAGSMIFGIGWGMSGICPGTAYINIGTFDMRIVYFVGMMLLGNFVFRYVTYLLSRSPVMPAGPEPEPQGGS